MIATVVSPNRRLRAVFLAVVTLLGAGRIGRAQQPTPSAPPPPTPDVGALAPDFTIAGATRYGLLRDSVRLSDLRGQTVVLAFFIRARTRG